MKTYAPPVVRCTRVVTLQCGAQVACRGWLVSRALHPEEPPGRSLTCSWCGEDYDVIGGALVPAAYPATAETVRLLARHDHAAAIVDATLRRREVGT